MQRTTPIEAMGARWQLLRGKQDKPVSIGLALGLSVLALLHLAYEWGAHSYMARIEVLPLSLRRLYRSDTVGVATLCFRLPPPLDGPALP